MKSEDLKKTATSELSQAQIFYLKRIEKENFDRVVKLKRMRQRNIWTGLGLAGSVLGIYTKTAVWHHFGWIHKFGPSVLDIELFPKYTFQYLYSIFTVKQENFLDELDEKRA